MSGARQSPSPVANAVSGACGAHDVRRAWLPIVGIVGGTLVGVATAALVRRARSERDDRWWFLSDGLAVDFEKGGVSVKPYADTAPSRPDDGAA